MDRSVRPTRESKSPPSRKRREKGGAPASWFGQSCCESLGEEFQGDCGYVVVRLDAVGKRTEAVEEVIQRFGCGLGLALRPEFGHTSGRELDALGIERFVQAVGSE